jgi:inosose dehydratase
MSIINPRLAVGHTGITWTDENAEAGIRCIAGLGFHNIEIFAWVLKTFYDQGKKTIFKENKIPLISSYFSVDIVNPDLRKAEIAKLSGWADITAGYGGKYATFGGNSVNRSTFNFEEHKKYIVDFVNEAARILNDKGLRLSFHPHTGTPVETQAEIASFLDAVDTKYTGFAPDIGQIQKGGADPMDLIKKYISIIQLVHLKDYSGKVQFDETGKEIDTTGYACYTPLGRGVVDIAGILEYLEKSVFKGPVLVELDRGPDIPLPAEEAAAINKEFLVKLGYRFGET